MVLSAADFELLLQSNRILSSKLKPEEVLVAVMELATTVVRADAASLLLLDESTNELYFDVALGRVKDSVKQIRLKVGEGIAGWVAKERHALIVNDVSADSRFSKRADKSTQFTTRSILAVPLITKGRLVGVVEAINKINGGVFSDEDREAFEMFASQAAIAIENAELFSAVTREKEKLNTIVAEMSDGILLLDRNGIVRLANEAAGRYLGAGPASLLGRHFDAGLFPEFEVPPLLGNLEASAERASTLELVRHKGKDFYLDALVLKLASDRASDGYLAMLHDATEERRGEKLKQNFLSLISHKLKTPLTVILGYAPQLLARDADSLTDAQRKALTAIQGQGEKLAGLVDKLLRFTTVESDSVSLKKEPLSLASVVREAIEELSLPDGDRSPVFDIDKALEKAPRVIGDRALLLDVVKNLLDNATKFNDKPSPRVAVSAQSDKSRVTLSVADNGTGIPSEEQEKVFRKFYQVENSFTGQVPGAGLGLALCKKAVEAMGGSIHLVSEIGKGTTVSFQLPLEKSA